MVVTHTFVISLVLFLQCDWNWFEKSEIHQFRRGGYVFPYWQFCCTSSALQTVSSDGIKKGKRKNKKQQRGQFKFYICILCLSLLCLWLLFLLKRKINSVCFLVGWLVGVAIVHYGMDWENKWMLGLIDWWLMLPITMKCWYLYYNLNF